jgi:hypothetical protein
MTPRFFPLDQDDPRTVATYVLHARLGSGGMGRVYLSFTPGGRAIAIKLVRPEFADDPEFRARFRREVAAAQRVQGIYTAPVVDADVDARVPWLATAYVPGPSLHRAVAEYGPLPVDTVSRLMSAVAEGLGSVHGAGLIHRDLKPANVLLAEDGPRVIDFGIAHAADATTLTKVGVGLGTPAFMAPEQVRGTAVSPATDVFALGHLAFYAAAGHTAFGEGHQAAIVHRIGYEQPNLEGCPAQLRGLIERCLQKDPADRPKMSEIIEQARVLHPTDRLTWLPPAIAAALAAYDTTTVFAPRREQDQDAGQGRGRQDAAAGVGSAAAGGASDGGAGATTAPAAGTAMAGASAATAPLAADALPAGAPGQMAPGTTVPRGNAANAVDPANAANAVGAVPLAAAAPPYGPRMNAPIQDAPARAAASAPGPGQPPPAYQSTAPWPGAPGGPGGSAPGYVPTGPLPYQPPQQRKPASSRLVPALVGGAVVLVVLILLLTHAFGGDKGPSDNNAPLGSGSTPAAPLGSSGAAGPTGTAASDAGTNLSAGFSAEYNGVAFTMPGAGCTENGFTDEEFTASSVLFTQQGPQVSTNGGSNDFSLVCDDVSTGVTDIEPNNIEIALVSGTPSASACYTAVQRQPIAGNIRYTDLHQGMEFCMVGGQNNDQLVFLQLQSTNDSTFDLQWQATGWALPSNL